LPSSPTGINPAGSGWPAASSRAAGSPARPPISQLPTAAAKASAPTSVITRQIVAFDGGAAGLVPARKVQISQHPGRDVPDPPGDRRVALYSRHDRCRGQRQHRGNRVIPALIRPAT